MVLGLYMQVFWGWPNSTMERIILSLRLLDYWIRVSSLKFPSTRVSLSKALKIATSSIQEYLNPNHGNIIFGDKDETEKII
jgi:hypothetical protein